ncbi:hypothetical protein DH2020_028635 [Rehmannia glutinosa]|uniref:AT-hook motif nuclear-localized protein n=1 Tax=Rehmannia glutinosa TaxID=99300 RepID=A0ABR0VU36_REHGL
MGISGNSNIHGGGGGGGGSAAAQPAGVHIHTPPVFKNFPNHSISVQHNVGVSGGGGGGVSGSSFHVENPSPSFSHGRSLAMVSGLSPLSASKNSSGGMSSAKKARRGRPRGTGWKQKLAPLGEWMNSSAGLAFTPHVLHVGVGEDIAAKILAFAQQRPRALCVMSANGSVSAITLRQPTSSGGTVTYEVKTLLIRSIQILCLSGSYLVAENGGPLNRTGGISISVCSPDGHIIGGAIGGKLIAANSVQVVACSFVYGGTKPKNKDESGTRDEKHPFDQSAEKSLTPITAASSQTYTPNSGSSVWPPVQRPEIKYPQTDIDLMRG